MQLLFTNLTFERRTHLIGV